MRHIERLQKLIDLTGTLEYNIYLYNELTLLKKEINIDILDAKIETLKQINK